MIVLMKRWIELLPRNRLRQLWYVPMLAVAMGLMMVRMLILARWLPLHEFAQFSEGVLVSNSFCMLRCLGLQSLLQREWPVDLMRGQQRRAVVLAAQCNLITLVCALLCLVVMIVGPKFTAILPVLLILGIIHGVSQQAFLIATVESRSRGNSVRYAVDNVVRASLALVLGCGLALVTRSAYCVLIAEALLSIVISAVIFRGAVKRAGLGTWQLYNTAFRKLTDIKWNSALALLAVGAIGFVITNTDRWLAVEAFDRQLFGVYSFGWIILMISQSAQTVVNASAYPLLARRFATDGYQGAFRICKYLSFGALAVAAAVLGPAWFLADWGVHRWFSSYSPVTEILPLLFLVALVRISDFWSSYLLIVGQEMRMLGINIGIVFVGSVVWLIITRPWLGAVTLTDVALLAVIFAVLSHCTSAVLAWYSRV